MIFGNKKMEEALEAEKQQTKVLLKDVYACRGSFCYCKYYEFC